MLRRALILAAALVAVPAGAVDVAASAPTATSVTIYRAPYRNGGSLDLNALGGFALVTETRTVRLPAGESRLRFEGVVGGIQPESAIVTGLPGGVIEKNRDAALLSPSALIEAALNADVTLTRTSKATGKVTLTPARIRSASPDGVIFETAAGVEALRCSGVPETFRYARVPAGLSSVPTLSVATHAEHAVTATVTVSYLAQGFDWAADYTASVAGDGRTLDLAAWITLANGNGESLTQAQAQIIAGRLNRESVLEDEPEPPRAIAVCWPQGTTSDSLPPSSIELVRPFPDEAEDDASSIVVTAQRRGMVMDAPAVMAPAPPPPPPPPEALGDLKLYRIPQPTTVAARQAKQTRLLDQRSVPFDKIYLIDLNAGGSGSGSARALLRVANTEAGKLGIPLPAGHVAVFQSAGPRRLYAGAADLRDTAEGEDVDLDIGDAPGVRFVQSRNQYSAKPLKLDRVLPGVTAVSIRGQTDERVTITNDSSAPIRLELRLRTDGASQVTGSSQPMEKKDGRPIFRLTIPANDSITVDYSVS